MSGPRHTSISRFYILSLFIWKIDILIIIYFVNNIFRYTIFWYSDIKKHIHLWDRNVPKFIFSIHVPSQKDIGWNIPNYLFIIILNEVWHWPLIGKKYRVVNFYCICWNKEQIMSFRIQLVLNRYVWNPMPNYIQVKKPGSFPITGISF
jgi:hypothetical protein